MPSISSSPTRMSTSARRASDSRPAQAMARIGLAARGIIYILIGWVAILVALGRSTNQADQQGALQLLVGKPYGLISLWLLGIGFVAYSLWRLSEAAFGVTGEGNGAGPRLKSLGRGVVYAFFVVLTIKVISGKQGSQSRQQQDVTAQAMQHPAGRWLVAIVGVIIVIGGLALVLEGLRHKFMKQLRTAQMSARTRPVVQWLGTVR